MRNKTRKTLRLIIIILVMSLCGSSGMMAQLRYGFRLGGEFADMTLKNSPGCDAVNRSGFSGGLMLEYQMPRCGFAPDIAVVYSRYNARFRVSDHDILDPGRNYIDIPLHFKWKFWLKSFHNLFGPMIYTGPSLSVNVDKTNGRDANLKKLQPGWDVGIGFDIVNFIQITGGYRFGLGNAINDFPMAGVCAHANSWNLTVNILFDF